MSKFFENGVFGNFGHDHLLVAMRKTDKKRTETGPAIGRVMKTKELIAAYSGSAKPLCVGSIPTRASNNINNLQKFSGTA
jgi:hypothetical protein